MVRAGGIRDGPTLDGQTRDRQLPAPHPDPLWLIEREGFDVDRLRVDGSLFSLADGNIGTSGAPLSSHPGLYRSVVASGVYVGSGPSTHLLTAPVVMQLPYDLTFPTCGRRV